MEHFFFYCLPMIKEQKVLDKLLCIWRCLICLQRENWLNTSQYSGSQILCALEPPEGLLKHRLLRLNLEILIQMVWLRPENVNF